MATSPSLTKIEKMYEYVEYEGKFYYKTLRNINVGMNSLKGYFWKTNVDNSIKFQASLYTEPFRRCENLLKRGMIW